MSYTPEERKRHVAYQRKSFLRDPERRYEIVRKYRAKSDYWSKVRERAKRLTPEKVAAWKAVYSAVRGGKLVRPDRCSKCHRQCRPQAHHPDYFKPLDVIWLCRPCHLALGGKKVRVYRKGDPRPCEKS